MANTVSRIISDETLNRIIQIESAGNPNAKAPTSSAAGLGQFITGTWNATVSKHRPDLAKNGIPARVGTGTASLQLEMLARFTEDNARALGAGYTDGDLYLAHFLGLGDARKLCRAEPSTMAASVVSPGAVTANHSILAGKNCGEVRRWAQQSMENRWAKAGKPDWVKRYAAPQAIKPPVVDAPKQAPAKDAGKVAGGAAGGAVIVAGGTAAAAEAGWGWLEWSIAIVVLAALIGIAVFAWRRWQARKTQTARIDTDGTQAVSDALTTPTQGSESWISTGDQSQEPLLLSPQGSGPSLVQLSAARLALSSAASPAAPSPQPSARKPRRNPSAKRSPKTRGRPTSSRASKSSAVRKSSRKRKPKSRARSSKG